MVELAISERSDQEGETQTADTEAARTAFASYASADQPRILDRVASVHAATGLDVWLACADLNPGDDWRERLVPEIVARDIFLLFWSVNAARSAG
jgi:hypothetical protein